MNQPTQALEHASVRQYCKALRMPVIGANFVRLSEQAIKEQRSHIGYLEALLVMEAEERDRHAIQKRLRDAKLPRLKTLEEFDFNQARQIPAAKIRALADGGYIERAEPVVFIGECGTGKTHLATGLCVAACRQKRRARFTTAANLVNELVDLFMDNRKERIPLWKKGSSFDSTGLDYMQKVASGLADQPTMVNHLSKREREVVELVAKGLSDREIETHLGLSQHTVKNLLSRIYDKLGVSNRVELVLFHLTRKESAQKRASDIDLGRPQ
jgi:DNA-binding NarL/FixJ family response regulator